MLDLHCQQKIVEVYASYLRSCQRASSLVSNVLGVCIWLYCIVHMWSCWELSVSGNHYWNAPVQLKCTQQRNHSSACCCSWHPSSFSKSLKKDLCIWEMQWAHCLWNQFLCCKLPMMEAVLLVQAKSPRVNAYAKPSNADAHLCTFWLPSCTSASFTSYVQSLVSQQHKW